MDRIRHTALNSDVDVNVFTSFSHPRGDLIQSHVVFLGSGEFGDNIDSAVLSSIKILNIGSDVPC